MNLQLEGKLALVTGSTAGIGFAIAKGLAAEGARVVVNGRTDARVATALKAIRRDHPGAWLDGFVADLSRAEESLAAYERFPNLEILVNNLGTYEAKPFEQITDADWHAIIETNFMSGVRLSRYFLPKMKAAGWGRIIFISSESAVNIPVEMVHYGVTKTMQVPEFGDPRQQPRHLRSQAFRADHRRRLARHHRNQFHERRAPQPLLSAEDEGRRMGAHHFHFQRIGGEHSRGDGPLRRNQDDAVGAVARLGRDDIRHGCDRELDSRGPYALGRRGEVRRGYRKDKADHNRGFREGVLPDHPPKLHHSALRHAGRGSGVGGLCGEPTVVGDQRSGIARGWRDGAVDLVVPQPE